jgi:hypothetical protein
MSIFPIITRLAFATNFSRFIPSFVPYLPFLTFPYLTFPYISLPFLPFLSLSGADGGFRGVSRPCKAGAAARRVACDAFHTLV